MSDKIANKKQGTIGYNSSLLSFTIVGINIISVFMRLNNGVINSSVLSQLLFCRDLF